MSMNWKKLLSSKRRKPSKAIGQQPSANGKVEFRTEHERDFDRILFSTPVRRLADKTQVFPLERNDSVRNRLTHSHEVSNLCRSMGTRLAFADRRFSGDPANARSIPSVLAAAGLAHDLGNPPFGHQGEAAIRAWFIERRVLQRQGLTAAQRKDFLEFEGNAQTLRLLTRLQLVNDNYGLDLTYATLAAVLKYPTGSDGIVAKNVARKKHGYFESEKAIVADIWSHTGLNAGVRHPLTFIMEACDDIAYVVLDAEDAVKKGLVSFADLIAFLKHECNGEPVALSVCDRAAIKHAGHQKSGLSPAELNDVSMQMFRVYAIGQLVIAAYEAFVKNNAAIERGSLRSDLLTVSNAATLHKALRKFDRVHAYRHKSVLSVEAVGYKTIFGLMDMLWRAITERQNIKELGSPRKTPFLRYAYERISENYRRQFEATDNKMPMRYKEAQLLTDMISGMTDSFAVNLLEDLRRYDDTPRP
jgi:dGTPase